MSIRKLCPEGELLWSNVTRLDLIRDLLSLLEVCFMTDYKKKILEVGSAMKEILDLSMVDWIDNIILPSPSTRHMRSVPSSS